MTRVLSCLVVVFAGFLATIAAQRPSATVEVYKSPTCGCCSKWVEHLKAAGLTVRTTDTEALDDLKNEHGVPRQVRSCHSTQATQATQLPRRP